jgi:pectate lyase
MGRWVLGCLLLCGWVSVVMGQTQLAFPTAEGFGRFAVGGRGGKAYNINSLAGSDGSGGSCNAGGCGGSAPFTTGTVTFLDCLKDRFGVGARTCIFRVGGTIDHGYMPTNSYIVQPYLTIAGQTAPGNGILIRGIEITLYGNQGGGTGRNAHDIVIRHIRLRNRFYASSTQCNLELITCVFGCYNVIADHVSGGWNFRSALSSAYSTKGVTYQWNLLSEGIQGYHGSGSDT